MLCGGVCSACEITKLEYKREKVRQTSSTYVVLTSIILRDSFLTSIQRYVVSCNGKAFPIKEVFC